MKKRENCRAQICCVRLISLIILISKISKHIILRNYVKKKPKWLYNLVYNLLSLLRFPSFVSLLERNLIRQTYLSRVDDDCRVHAWFVTYTHKIAALTVRSPQRERAIQCRPKQSTKQCVIAKNTLFLSAQPSLSSSSVWPVHDFRLSSLLHHQRANMFWTVQLITINNNARLKDTFIKIIFRPQK